MLKGNRSERALYFIYKARKKGMEPRLMSEARRVNNYISEYVAGRVRHLMKKKGIPVNLAASAVFIDAARNVGAFSTDAYRRSTKSAASAEGKTG